MGMSTQGRGGAEEIRTPDLRIANAALWPAELLPPTLPLSERRSEIFPVTLAARLPLQSPT